MKANKSIGMVVWNDFRNDARVLKEARTLARAGYRVTVHALLRPGKTPRFEELEPGLCVRRVSLLTLPNWRRGQAKDRRSAHIGAVGVKAGKGGRIGLRVRLAMKMASRGFTHAGLLFWLARLGPDAVHAHDVNVLPTAWLAARLRVSRLVYDAHEISTSREGYRGLRNFVGWIEKRLAPRADAMITTTDMRAKFFARAYKVPRPLVLQNRPHLTAVKDQGRIATELGLEENWPIVLYQGGIQQGRGLEMLVDAASLVPECYFVLIGGGRLVPAIEDRIERQGLAGRVHVIPTVGLAELTSYTASADIGVQPLLNTCLNHFTTDSNKLFEYAMAGLPVVASDFPEIRRIVRQHELGLLFDPAVPGALAAAISALVKDQAAREKFARNARQSAAALSWEEQEDKLLDFYARVFGEPARGSVAANMPRFALATQADERDVNGLEPASIGVNAPSGGVGR